MFTDHGLDVISALRQDGHIEVISSAVKALAGYHPDEVVGSHYSEFIHPDDVGPVEARLQRVIRLGETGMFSVRTRRKDGSWRSVHATARSFLEDPAVNAIVVMTRDVTDELSARQRLTDAANDLRRLSHRLLQAQESERARLAWDLHDDVCQMLVGLSLSMSRRIGGSEELRNAIDSWKDVTTQALEHLRRIVLGLRPPELDQLGLGDALRQHAARIQRVVGHNIEVQEASDVGRLPPEVEISAFRICQEALANAIKYADAAHISVSLRRGDGRLDVVVQDDGKGFEVALAGLDPEGPKGLNLGLLSMRERASLVGGTLDVASRPGAGTTIHAVLPSVDGMAGMRAETRCQ